MSGIMPHVARGGLLCALVAVGSAQAQADVRDDLARLATRSVFFGHQSVGMNVLDGVKELAREAGVPLQVAEAKAGARVPAGTIAHAWLGTNEQPDTKLEAFARWLDATPDVDVALVKLCYVDFSAATDARALAARYQATIAALRRSHPRTTFVHVTAPVSTVQGGPKALVKRLLGREPYGLVENVRREEYNALLRAAYAGKEPLLDLARLEATADDGSVAAVTWNGHRAPALQRAYTDDGGHLNAAGRRRVARALVALLASLPEPARVP